MTMTDTEAKALELVNETSNVRQHMFQRSASSLHRALCRAIEREAATEARHAEEMRELKERFSEVAAKVDAAIVADNRLCAQLLLTPFILPAPDPLVEGLCAAISDMGHGDFVSHETLGKALSARGYELRKIGEAGE